MGILVYKSHYVRGGAKVKNYASYIGTRPGVVKIMEDRKNEAATTNQNAYIESFLKAQPEIEKSELYQIYLKDQTLGNASELISYIEETYEEDQVTGIEGYLEYMATRPGAVKVGTNGLFTDEDELVNMDEVKRHLENNKGIIFTPIVSLTREDAETFGYTTPKKWQDLIKAHRNEIAELYRIDPENFEWYGAFHNEPNHPHIHLLFFSKDGNQGWQNPDYTFEKMKRLLSTDIIRPYREQIYSQKSDLRLNIKHTAEAKIQETISKIEQKNECPDQMYRMMYLLKEAMKDNKGKLQYGYLPKSQKLIVDNIVNELEKDPDIREFMKQWDVLKNNLQSLYREDGYQHIPLSQIKEFTSIKNMIIQEAINLPDQQEDHVIDTLNQSSQDFSHSHRHTSVFHHFASIAKRMMNDYYNGYKQHLKTKEELEQERERKLALGLKVD